MQIESIFNCYYITTEGIFIIKLFLKDMPQYINPEIWQ